jgi:signal transduction histidine kinase
MSGIEHPSVGVGPSGIGPKSTGPGLTSKVLIRVVPLTAVTLAALLWLAHQRLHQTVDQEARAGLDQIAQMTAESLGHRLDGLRTTVRSIAVSDWIVQSRVNEQPLPHDTVPVLLEALRRPDASLASLTVTDAAGRTIVSSDPNRSIDVSPFHADVMAGQSYFDITSDSITIAEPITGSGKPNGLLAARYDTEAFLKHSQSIPSGQRLRLLRDRELLFQSQPESVESEWLTATSPLTGYPSLVAQRAETYGRALAAMQFLNPTLVGLSVAALAVVVLAVIVASILTTRPLVRLAAQVGSIESTGDFSRRVDRQEINEFRELAGAFNGLLETLARTTEACDQLAVSDSSLRQANAKLLRINEELEQFAHAAPRDLCEPLRTVTSYCELLREDCYDALTEDGHRYTRYVIEAAQRTRALIQDLLVYSKIESQGREPISVDANELVAQVLERMQQEIETTETHVVIDPLPVVHVDPEQLVVLLEHLVGNAIKYRGTEKPVIHISAVPRPSQWLLRVEDNGIGIAPEDQEAIFQIFQRLDRCDPYRGTGIGLAICKRIVERFQGRIWVESELGAGSVFYVAIPRRAETAAVGRLARAG